MGVLPILIVCRIVPELLEKLSFKHVPAPLQPRQPLRMRQRLQLLYIVRLTGHQRSIVRDKALCKAVLLRYLVFLKAPVDKQPLDVLMPLPSRVAGVIDTLGEIVYTSDAGGDGLHLVF